jgi:hypothetical protein
VDHFLCHAGSIFFVLKRGAKSQKVSFGMTVSPPLFGNFPRFFEIGPGWGKFILRAIKGGVCKQRQFKSVQ